MSAEELSSLRRMWEQWGGPIGGPEQRARFGDRWWHPEIRYLEDLGDGMEVFEGELSIERTVEAADRLVALVRFNLVSAGGDVPTDHLWGYVCGARDGKLVYLRAYWDPDEALSAAGVDSP